MLRLAFSNLKTKPLRTVGLILAIAISVALIFCMLSFKSAVHSYIYASETASSGKADIRIATQSSTDKIFDVATPLAKMLEVSEVVPCLSLYALLDGEYVQVRGYQSKSLTALQDIDVIDGDLQSMIDGTNTDNVVISKQCAQHFSLKVGDEVSMSLGGYSARFFVGAISSQSGYFLADSPYQIVGLTRHVARLISGVEADEFCNEIFVSLKEGVDVPSTIAKIKSIDKYKDMLVESAGDEGYITSQTQSLTAPVVLAGAAVLALGVVAIALMFLMSEKEKVALLSKLRVVGATRKQIWAVFLIESAIIALIGVVVGIALACAIYAMLLNFALSKAAVMTVSALKLLGSAGIGFVVAMLSSVLPIARALKGSIRQNQLSLDARPLWLKLLAIGLVVATIVCVLLQAFVESATPICAVLSLVFALSALGVGVPFVLRMGAGATQKSSRPFVRFASIGLLREKRFARSVSVLTLGVTVSVMLFMAWSLTTNIFDDYIGEFENMVFVSNLNANSNEESFEQFDQVDDAIRMVWQQADLKGNGFDKKMNILGSSKVLDVINFKFITPKDEIKASIAQNEPCIVVDVALNKLYGVQQGDTLTISVGDVEKEVVVCGIVEHKLFSGNYIIASKEMLLDQLDLQAEMMLVLAKNSATETANQLRASLAKDNCFAIEALQAYKWDRDSMDAVFDLVGLLAFIVAAFVIAVSVVASLVARSTADRERNTLLNAGMSKRTLLAVEWWECFAVAITAFVLSVGISALLTFSLIDALRLFGLYFGFMYDPLAVFAVAGVTCALYCLQPLAFRFKKGYNLTR